MSQLHNQGITAVSPNKNDNTLMTYIVYCTIRHRCLREEIEGNKVNSLFVKGGRVFFLPVLINSMSLYADPWAGMYLSPLYCYSAGVLYDDLKSRKCFKQVKCGMAISTTDINDCRVRGKVSPGVDCRILTYQRHFLDKKAAYSLEASLCL